MNDRRPIRVLMADDHPVVRAGIVSMLSKEPDIRVIGGTGDGERVERLTVETAPDVLVLDVNMPGLDPVAATRIRWPLSTPHWASTPRRIFTACCSREWSYPPGFWARYRGRPSSSPG